MLTIVYSGGGEGEGRVRGEGMIHKADQQNDLPSVYWDVSSTAMFLHV